MFKHRACGGQHETVDQARQCERVNGAIRTHLQTPEDLTPVEPIRPAFVAPIYPARKPVSNRPRKPLGVAYAEALAEGSPASHADLENGPETFFNQPEPTERYRSAAERTASPGRINFIKILLAERDWETGLDNDPIARRVLEGKEITADEACWLIPALKALPKKAAPAPASPKEQPWKRLSREVPAGNYCVDVDGKNHFYRVSVGKNGYYKLQERASEELHFVSLARYAGILQTILDAGIEASRLRYSRELSRCWHCHLTLTDNVGNPHFSRGLGPKCGEEN